MLTSLIIEELLPFGRLNINELSIQSHNFVTNMWTLMTLIVLYTCIWHRYGDAHQGLS